MALVTGAADGYYRMTDKPASTLLHLGPGLANAAANLHNAKKAGSGIVNIVGEHALYHIKYDTPLTADIEGIARPMSDWVKTSPSAQAVATMPRPDLTNSGSPVMARSLSSRWLTADCVTPRRWAAPVMEPVSAIWPPDSAYSGVRSSTISTRSAA